MFSGIPQRFTAPLGLLPDTQKLAFRSEPGGLSKLAAVRVSTCETPDRLLIFLLEYLSGRWLLEPSINCCHSPIHLLITFQQYLELFDSPSEVFSLITPHDSQFVALK
jgi:hypothetical protein